MELRVAKSDLQRELQLCQGIVEKRSTIPILSNVLLKTGEGKLEIVATDLDVTFESSCGATVSQQGGVTVEARRFFEIVRSLPEEQVHLTLQDNSSLAVESGTAKFRLLGLPPEDYPSLPTVDQKGSSTIPLADMKSMIEKVIFAVTHEETRFQLNGALLKVLPDKFQMVATDGHRLALVDLPLAGETSDPEEMTILIPRKALQELARIEGSESENIIFGRSENHLYFTIGKRRLIARMIDVNFPNYMEVIARDNDRRVIVDRDRLQSTIRRVSLVSSERTRAIRFDFGPGRLTVSSTSAELGDARETVPIDYSGAPFFVGLNAGYVNDFLSVVETPVVSLELKDENSQCIARPSSDRELPYDYLYVVMPMRITPS